MPDPAEVSRSESLTAEEYGSLNPGLELIPVAGPANEGRHIHLTVDEHGRPVPGPGETALERWEAPASLLVDFDDESGNGQLIVGFAIETAVCRLVITDTRLIGTVHAGFTPKWGVIDVTGDQSDAPAVLGFSWPLDEITNVNVHWEKKAFRGRRMTRTQIQASRPYSVMSFDGSVPTRCDDDWVADPALNEGDGYALLGRAIVTAAARFRLDRGIADNPSFLEALIAGERMVADTLESAPMEEGRLIAHMGILMPER